MKKCSKCGEVKPLDAFSKKDKRKPEVRHSWCKLCKNERERNARRARGLKRNPNGTGLNQVERNRRNCDELTAGYVALTLRVPVSQLTPHLLELQRNNLQIKRARRELKTTLESLDDHAVRIRS